MASYTVLSPGDRIIETVVPGYSETLDLIVEILATAPSGRLSRGAASITRGRAMRRLGQHLYEWVEIHGQSRGLPYPWNSHLIHLEEAGVRALVDPLPMSDEDLAEIEEIGAPTHILITNNYHERSADEFRARWHCQTLLHENQVGEAECEVDCTLQNGQVLWNSIEVVRVPDVRFAEEVSFLVKEDQALIVGDLVSGPRQDVGIPHGAIGIRAPELYVDLTKARATLRSLLALPFDRLVFAHGGPLEHGAKAVLKEFVADDRIWLDLEAVRSSDRN